MADRGWGGEWGWGWFQTLLAKQAKVEETIKPEAVSQCSLFPQCSRISGELLKSGLNTYAVCCGVGQLSGPHASPRQDGGGDTRLLIDNWTIWDTRKRGKSPTVILNVPLPKKSLSLLDKNLVSRLER